MYKEEEILSSLENEEIVGQLIILRIKLCFDALLFVVKAASISGQ